MDNNVKYLNKEASRFCDGEFIFDEYNTEVCRQMVYYANKDSRFKGNLKKGIILLGGKGVGKSVLLKALNSISLDMDKFSIINSVSLAGYFSKIGDTAFDKICQYSVPNSNSFHEKFKPNHIMVNDLGRESNESIYMGQRESVGARLIYERYEMFQNSRIKTHFTTNLMTDKSIIDLYGDLNFDRLREMCNFFYLEGPSRRK